MKSLGEVFPTDTQGHESVSLTDRQHLAGGMYINISAKRQKNIKENVQLDKENLLHSHD